MRWENVEIINRVCSFLWAAIVSVSSYYYIRFLREQFKRATDRKSDITKELHKYCIKRATTSEGQVKRCGVVYG